MDGHEWEICVKMFGIKEATGFKNGSAPPYKWIPCADCRQKFLLDAGVYDHMARDNLDFDVDHITCPECMERDQREKTKKSTLFEEGVPEMFCEECGEHEYIYSVGRSKHERAVNSGLHYWKVKCKKCTHEWWQRVASLNAWLQPRGERVANDRKTGRVMIQNNSAVGNREFGSVINAMDCGKKVEFIHHEGQSVIEYTAEIMFSNNKIKKHARIGDVGSYSYKRTHADGTIVHVIRMGNGSMLEFVEGRSKFNFIDGDSQVPRKK